MKRIVTDIKELDLDFLVDKNISIQCDSFEEELTLVMKLSSLGVTTKNGAELYDHTDSFGEYIWSNWNLYAEEGYYLIKKTRLGRYYIEYSEFPSNRFMNSKNFFKVELKEDTLIVENKTNWKDILIWILLIGNIITALVLRFV